MPFLSPSCTRCPYGTSGLSSTWLRSNFRASSLPSTLLWCAVAQDCASGVRSATEPTSCSGVLLLLIAFSRSARHSTRLPFSRHGGNSCRHRHILISFAVVSIHSQLLVWRARHLGRVLTYQAQSG